MATPSEYRDHIVDILNEMISTKSEDLCAGNAKSFEEYRFEVGQMRGMAQAIEVVKDQYTKMLQE